jgi:hypothetical protein
MHLSAFALTEVPPDLDLYIRPASVAITVMVFPPVPPSVVVATMPTLIPAVIVAFFLPIFPALLSANFMLFASGHASDHRSSSVGPFGDDGAGGQTQ